MKNFIAIAAVIIALGWADPVAADAGGRCHFHGSKPASEATVLGCAVDRRDNLVKAGKLDASWKAASHDQIETIDGKKGKEWKVTFRNAAAKDKSKDALYMFFTLPGNFIAANHSGK